MWAHNMKVTWIHKARLGNWVDVGIRRRDAFAVFYMEMAAKWKAAEAQKTRLIPARSPAAIGALTLGILFDAGGKACT